MSIDEWQSVYDSYTDEEQRRGGVEEYGNNHVSVLFWFSLVFFFIVL